MNSQNFASPQEIDLSVCEKEAIHIPGAIQPHGVLFVLQEPQLTILQVSDNTEHFFGISSQTLINKNLQILFCSSQFEVIKHYILQSNHDINKYVIPSLKARNNLEFNGTLHKSNEVWILELEPISNFKKACEINFYDLVNSSIAKIQKSTIFETATKTIVQEVRQITGYDRVMIYRFEPDNSGVIIAEDKKEEIESYFNLHYPASDIPQQARKLYYENWLRLIVNINYQPVKIIPTNNPLTNAPIDLSSSILRSISPVHCEYARNMGFSGSLCISLVNDKQLWGLLVCHHYSPKSIDYQVRNYCQFLGQIMSIYLVKKQEEEAENYRKTINLIQKKLQAEISENYKCINDIFKRNSQKLLDIVKASGVAIYLNGNLTLIGKTPSQTDVQELLIWWLGVHREEVFYTNSLSQIYPKAEKFKDVASGLLAISVFLNHSSYHILWFRDEVIQTVNWGGNPQKPILVENDSMRLSPRKSFELWKETVRRKSLPWQQIEIDVASELRETLMLTILEFSQAALQEAAQNAEEANRSKSRFLAKMSHELRTPLNAIIGFTQLMSRNDNLSEEQYKNLRIINRSGEHLLGLINDVLEMSKIETGRLTLNNNNCDLYQMLDAIQEMLQLRAAAKQLQLSFLYSQEIPQYIITDESKLRQILINLLENAIKFTSQGKVLLRLFLSSNNQQQLNFEIIDTGPGIALEEVNNLFEPFTQTEAGRKSMQGTGLGLYISRQFARLMGGDITVKSILDKGSTFTFNIQISKVQNAAIKSKCRPNRVIAIKPNDFHPRILVVEDVEENRQMLVTMLENFNFQVRTAINGVEAISIWQSWAPDLILMDLLMPVMDGYQATKHIKATLKGQATTIIALTANVLSEDCSIITEFGCDDFMSKPFREEVLLEKIALHLGLQCIYAEESEYTSSVMITETQQLTPQDLDFMPIEWHHRLNWAALAMDDNLVMELIKKIPPDKKIVYQTLEKLVEDFRLDIIADLTVTSP